MSDMLTCLLLGLSEIVFGVASSKNPSRSEVDPDFKPVLLAAEFTALEVRPGDRIGLSLKFANEGTKAAQEDYKVFLHFEHPDPGCHNIKFQFDHDPTQPTTTWRPGETVVDGPYAIDVPDDLRDGEYHVHVGLYAPAVGGVRLLDVRSEALTLSRSASPSAEAQPEPLSESEVAARRRALTARLKNPVTLDSANYSFALDQDSGAFQLLDKSTGVLWGSNPARAWFGTVQLTYGKARYTIGIERFDTITRMNDGLKASMELVVNDQPTDVTLNVFIEALPPEPEGLRFRYDTETADTPNAFWTADNVWQVQSVRLLDNAFWTTDADNGYAVVPFRLGEMIPTDSGLPATRRYPTYSGSSMALYGAAKQGSALLIAWPHPDTELEVQTSWPDLPLASGRRMHSVSITLNGEAREFSVHPLGQGTYVDMGRAYRHIARRNGWLMTWAEKRREFPMVDQMFGAADFKPFVFGRILSTSRFNQTGKEQTRLSYTFQEAAQVAEHLHRDLEIDKAMYVLAGWIHRGYDNQHPDILPAAPECGGSDAMADCARRVKDCGFLFGLHDNYQDMYEDAPSWNAKYLNKNASGEPKMGGNWWGGQAWQVCAIEQVSLAARPETNLPKIAELFGPTIYFIDTTFAWGLVTCEDPTHPMSRWDDMKWKSRLCDLAKEHFGLFGSEEGREWAIPHADYMEGLLSHKIGADRPGKGYARRGDGKVIPMFEIVYGDCINLYGHQSDRATPDRPDYILSCLLYAEMPVYAFGPHLYYEEKVIFSSPEGLAPYARCFARADNGWAQGLNETDRLIKNTYEVLSWVNRLTAETPMTNHRFLTDDGNVEWSQFNDVQIWVNYGSETYTVPPVSSLIGSETVLPQYGCLVVSPTFIAFHASSFGGLDYETPALFTARALDGKPLAESGQIRIYHGFGDSRIRLAGQDFRVERESVIPVK